MPIETRSFGILLRDYRLRTEVDISRKPLTQALLAEYLDTLAGVPGYSGVMVNYWENGRRKPPPRQVVVGILQVLKQFNGVRSVAEANELLRSADYRQLDEDEIQQVGLQPGLQENPTIIKDRVEESPADIISPQEQPAGFWRKNLDSLFRWSEADAHARSSWAGMLIWSFAAITDRITPKTFLQVWGIIALWGGTAWLISPLLKWPLTDPRQRLVACVQFAVASLLVPLIVGFFSRPDTSLLKLDIPVRRQAVFLLKLAGGYAGFNGFALLLFLLALAFYYLTQAAMPVWLTGLLTGVPLLFAHVGARRIPADRYKMYGEIPQLHAADRLVLAVYPLIGVVFAWYIYFFYDVLANRLVGLILFIVLALAAYLKTRKA